MRTLARLAAIALIAPTLVTTAHAADKAKLQERVRAATGVVRQLSNVPDDSIPDAIAKKAHCVIVVPSFKKGAFLGGVQYGQGLATCYVAHKGWSAPAFVRMTGVSFGFQAGGQATDLVLVGTTKESGDKLLTQKIKLGGDVAVAAGPVGRNSKADTTGNAAFLTYSRSKGLFAGIDLTGDFVDKNDDDTEAYYGHNYSHDQLFDGSVPVPAGARPFIAAVTRVFGRGPR